MKLHLLFALYLVFSVFCISAVHAEENSFPQIFIENPDNFGLVQDVHLVMDDQATGGCWTNASLIKSKAALVLEQSDIPVKEKPCYLLNSIHPIIILTVLSQRNNLGGCFGSVSARVTYFSTQGYGQFFWKFPDAEKQIAFDKYTMPSLQTILLEDHLSAIHPKNLNTQAADFFEEFIATFAAKVIAGRRSEKVKQLFAEFPHLKNYITKEEIEGKSEN